MRAVLPTLLALLSAAANRGAQVEPRPADALPLGGPATVRDDGAGAFSFPSPTLDARERRAFAVGNAFFKDNWVQAPASAEGRDGLGPLFNARSCSSCHLRDGRGRPPADGEGFSTGLLLRIGVPGRRGDEPHPRYGSQLQDRAIEGVAAEAGFHVAAEAEAGAFEDGERFELVRPRYELRDLAYGPLGDEARLGARVAPQLIGLGLLEAIPAEALLRRADPADQDGDGISGRPHWVVGLRGGERALGRFGWKATRPSVEEQVAAAFVHDMGITSNLFPDEELPAEVLRGASFRSGGSPELSDHKLERVTFYSAMLAVPAQRDAGDPEVRRGAELFARLGCGACHVPTWTTGADAPHAGYRDRTIRPYTDLLLHDLGPELADGKHDGDAAPGEWRTPPLWGIGLFEAVSGHTRYLHDGRARGLSEAILWHGGEGARARAAFRELPAPERAALLRFLGSL